MTELELIQLKETEEFMLFFYGLHDVEYIWFNHKGNILVAPEADIIPEEINLN